MAVTIRDIAEKSGVSVSTVSLVINHKGYVSGKTRERVTDVIEKMNYKPLHSARKLATKMTGNIGYIVWEGHFYEVEMFYSQIFLGMEYAVRDSDYYILLTTIKEQFDPKENLPRFLKYNDIDGVALAGRVPNSIIDYLEHQRIPFVLIDYGVPGKVYNSVVIDNYNGAYSAVEHLIKNGRRRIGFVGGSFFHPSIKERYRGYKEALEYNGIDGNIFSDYAYLKDVETSRSIGERGASSLLSLDPVPDAIFCCNDSTAIGVMSNVQKKGYRIPDDVAIVGFDDIPSAVFNSPKLTTVRVPKLDIGKEAIKLLIELINNPDTTPQTRTISVELVKRESS